MHAWRHATHPLQLGDVGCMLSVSASDGAVSLSSVFLMALLRSDTA